MTSQTKKTDERIALETEAKAKGIKGVHLFGDEKLKLAIDKVKEYEAKDLEESKAEVVDTKPENARKVAPRMNVDNISRDDRAAMIQRLEAEDPECKYVFQSSNVSERELSAKGLEKTKYMVKNDIVCRTMKDSFVEFQEAKNSAQYEMMKSIEGKNSSYEVPCLEASAKVPKS